MLPPKPPPGRPGAVTKEIKPTAKANVNFMINDPRDFNKIKTYSEKAAESSSAYTGTQNLFDENGVPIDRYSDAPVDG